MTAEWIGRVIRDFKRGSVDTRQPLDAMREAGVANADSIVERQIAKVAASKVVDVTALYERMVEQGKAVSLYDSFLLRPPWSNASYCFVNPHGNVNVLNVVSVTGEDFPVSDRWESDQNHAIDWDEVGWVSSITVWVGGTSPQFGTMPTSGPMHAWLWAIDKEGHPLDLRWVHMRPDIPMEMWTNPQLVVMHATDFLNCRNVKLVEPVRPRAERRRVERTGVLVHEINVFPVGLSSRSPQLRRTGTGVPLTSVRGHVAIYGEEGRGLLFGKHAGRFWVPQHVRGSAELGEVEQSFVIEP